MASTIEVFCCYARKDKVLLDELKTHLIPLQREGHISVWNNTDISPGAEWEEEINKHLNTAQLILLLVSSDFMASEYCYSREMKRAVERHERREARVIPIILRPVDWKGTQFGKLQCLPSNAKPVKDWRSRDQALLDVATGIRKVVEGIIKQALDYPSMTPVQKPEPAEPKSGPDQSGTEALAKLREEMQKQREADRLLLEADKFAPNLFERERLIKQAVELYPDYKPSRYRQLGIDMSIAVLDDVDPYTPMDIRRLGDGYRFTKDKVERLTTSAISYLHETVLDTTAPDTEGLLYLACMYGYQQHFDEMVEIIDKAAQIDEEIKEEFREPKKLATLLRACGSDPSNLARLGTKIGLILPASKDAFCTFLKNYDLTEKHTFIEWLAIKRPDAPGVKGIFVIKITPPYAVNKGLVDASAHRVEDWKVETIVPVDKNVTIEELFDRLNSLFFLISPNE